MCNSTIIILRGNSSSGKSTVAKFYTRDKSREFGEKALRKWWAEKDYLPQIQEKKITQDLAMVEIVDLIKNDLSKEMVIC